MPEPDPVIHLVYKTHLDIGFTAPARAVVHTYFTRFIPQAVALAARTRDDGARRFRWTTGAWLIYEYLEQARPSDRRTLEAAITAGDIVWHALPFTMHSELMDADLFRFSLTLARTLDQRFGKQTIAAKMTDVPGHTRAIVPLLAEAGVLLLHIGVNEASSVPEVPPAFVWRDAATGCELLMIYEHAYGGLASVPGLAHQLAVVLTGDNLGPPSDTQRAQTLSTLQATQPGATIIVSTLNDFARQLDTVRDALPVITDEIGDTWIHGVGSDPTKVRHFRALSALRHEWLARPLDATQRARVDAFSRPLLLVAEHTWGLDEKTHLADTQHYRPAQLAQLRRTRRGQQMEASWAEQRAYLDASLATLNGSPLADEARATLHTLTPQPPYLVGFVMTEALTLTCGMLSARLHPATGAVVALTDTQTGAGWDWAGDAHPLAALTYQVYGQADYDRFWGQYIRGKDDPRTVAWAREDYTKPGLPLAQGEQWAARVTSAYRQGPGRCLLALTFPAAACGYGAPARVYLDYMLRPDGLHLTLTWFGKPACRIAEALWLSFVPRAPAPHCWRFIKLGQPVDPCAVVARGARTLHAVERDLIYDDGARALRIATHDAPLVAPGQPALLDFHDQPPEMRGGVHVNLYNNVWGTNFPMWFEDDALFRFSVTPLRPGA